MKTNFANNIQKINNLQIRTEGLKKGYITEYNIYTQTCSVTLLGNLKSTLTNIPVSNDIVPFINTNILQTAILGYTQPNNPQSLYIIGLYDPTTSIPTYKGMLYNTQPILTSGNQATTILNIRSYASAASQYFDVSIYWGIKLTNIPSSIVFPGGSSTNISSYTSANFSLYGCRFEMVSAAAGDTYFIGYLVTTVGN